MIEDKLALVQVMAWSWQTITWTSQFNKNITTSEPHKYRHAGNGNTLQPQQWCPYQKMLGYFADLGLSKMVENFQTQKIWDSGKDFSTYSKDCRRVSSTEM